MGSGSSNVRDASECDAEACAAIYAPYVIDTPITFENDPPLPARMAERIATAMRTHAWVVLENQGRVVGYGGPYVVRVDPGRSPYRVRCRRYGGEDRR